jgi:hypothetical protein
MNYDYTKINRLNSPNNYMYSAYQGNKFFDFYFKDRIKKIKSLQDKKYEKNQQKLQLFIYSRVNKFLNKILVKNFFSDLLLKKLNFDIKKKIDVDKQYRFKPLSSFSIRKEVKIECLLLSIINSQLIQKNTKLVKFWLDLLIQRFEVKKKIYTSYEVNFRKGKGDSNIASLYLMLAISLILFFCSTKKIKYMNTLLKVSDLICSLDTKYLVKVIPADTLSFILLIELLNVKLLLKNNLKNKKNYEFK